MHIRLSKVIHDMAGNAGQGVHEGHDAGVQRRPITGQAGLVHRAFQVVVPVFHRVQFGTVGGQREHSHVVRQPRMACGQMEPGPVLDEDRDRRGIAAADLSIIGRQMFLIHGFRIQELAPRQPHADRPVEVPHSYRCWLGHTGRTPLLTHTRRVKLCNP